MDRKYGYIKLGTMGEDEPVFILRAQDRLMPHVLAHYIELCTEAGPPEHHIEGIRAVAGDVERWQADHMTKTPSSDTMK